MSQAMKVLVLLAVAIVLICADRASTTKSIPSGTLMLADQRYDALTERFLRASKVIEEDRIMPGVQRMQEYVLEKVLWLAHRLKWHLFQKKAKLRAFDEIQRQTALETLKSPEMKTLMTLFRTPYEQRKLGELFIKRYRDRVLVEALLSAQQSPDPTIQEIATTLLHRQLEVYLKRDYSAVEVFAKLGILCNVYVLVDDKLPVLISYIKLLNEKQSRQETLVDVLTLALGNERTLVESIGATKMKSVHVDIVQALESSLVEKWLDEGLTPVDLLDRLFMSSDTRLFQSPALGTILTFIEQFNAKNPENKFTLLKWATETFEYDDVKGALRVAQQSEVTKDIVAPLVKDLENNKRLYKPSTSVW